MLAFDRHGADFLAALEQSGAVPLPPYIRGGIADARDRADYQTMFAEIDGSVAAPTAGLHFTPALMQALADVGVKTARVTLHVGAGTFQPVRVGDTDQHTMHAEWGEVPQATAEAIDVGQAGRSRSARRRCACSRAWRDRGRCAPGRARPTSSSRRASTSASSICC